MLNKMQLKLSNIKAFPAVAITVILALTLLVFGVYIIIPSHWFGIAATKTYPNMLVRYIFGGLIAAPSLPILYCNIKYDIKTLIKTKMHKLRPFVFWMGVTYSYLCCLRILGVGWLPPVFLLYLAMAAISFIIWLSNKYI